MKIHGAMSYHLGIYRVLYFGVHRVNPEPYREAVDDATARPYENTVSKKSW
jgi:hypothetical protein